MSTLIGRNGALSPHPGAYRAFSVEDALVQVFRAPLSTLLMSQMMQSFHTMVRLGCDEDGRNCFNAHYAKFYLDTQHPPSATALLAAYRDLALVPQECCKKPTKKGPKKSKTKGTTSTDVPAEAPVDELHRWKLYMKAHVNAWIHRTDLESSEDSED